MEKLNFSRSIGSVDIGARVLNMTHWRIRGKRCAAEILGLKPTTLASKMHKLGIVRQSKH